MKVNDTVKEIIPPILLVVLGATVLCFCFIFLKDKGEGDVIKEMAHLIRIIEALSAAAISIALPGALEIINPKSTEKVTPNIKASGALAVFVIVYLINPITF